MDTTKITIPKVSDLDRKAMAAARLRLDNLTKPLGSLGVLEVLAEQMAGVIGEPLPGQQKKALFFVGTRPATKVAYPLKQLAEFLAAELVLHDCATTSEGGSDFAAGVEQARTLHGKGFTAVGLGTDPVDHAFIQLVLAAEETGRGNYEQLLLGAPANVRVLVGAILQFAALRTLVLLDGPGTVLAAFLACRLAPGVSAFLAATQCLSVPEHADMARRMGLRPCLDMGLDSDAGIGAALGLSLLDAGIRVINEMSTFDEARVAYALHDLKSEETRG